MRVAGAGGQPVPGEDASFSGPTRPGGQVEIGDLGTGTAVPRVAGRGHGVVECAVPDRTGEIATATIRLPRATLAGRLRSERRAVEVDGQPFGVALWEFAQRAVIPVRCSPSLPGGAARRPVSVHLRNATLREALDAFCDAVNARARVDEDAALIRIEAR